MSINKQLRIGFEYFQAGQMKKAEEIYQKILQKQKQNAEALHILGIINYRNSNFDSAIQYISASLKIHSGNADAYNNLGLSYYAKLDFDPAIDNLQKAVRISASCGYYFNLGNVFKDKNQIRNAIDAYYEALRINPLFPEAHEWLGILMHSQGDFEKAITHYQTALKINPNNSLTYSNLGLAFFETGQHNKAICCYRTALDINPELPEANNNLGNAMRVKKRFEDALSYCQKALQTRQNFADPYNTIGRVYYDKGDLDQAIINFRKALEFDPNMWETYDNLGSAYMAKGHYHESSLHHKKAIALAPNLVTAHWNASLSLLSLGHLSDGWTEYEWRLKAWKRESYSGRRLSQPRWNGSDIFGIKIFLHTEQGFGDTIQFIRYAPLVARLGAKVLIECPVELKSLLATVPGIEQILSYNEPLPEFSFHCPLMSLPLVFRTTVDTIPREIPYITAATSLIKEWRERTDQYNSSFKVGIIWTGRTTHKNDLNRSCPLSMFAPLALLENVVFYSLQKGEAAKEAMTPPPGMLLLDFTEHIKDFSDTAALIENLDLVISVDTSVAHLAGALSKPVWTLLPFYPDWRWMLNRDDSPWYPTMRLFRQTSPGDWKPVIERLVHELICFCKTALPNRH